MGEESPCLQPQKGLPAPPRLGAPPLRPPDGSAAANALVQLAMAERKGGLQSPENKKNLGVMFALQGAHICIEKQKNIAVLQRIVV